VLGEAAFHYSTIPLLHHSSVPALLPTAKNFGGHRRPLQFQNASAAQQRQGATFAPRAAPRESVENAGRELEWFRVDKLAPLPFRPSNSSDDVAALRFRH